MGVRGRRESPKDMYRVSGVDDDRRWVQGAMMIGRWDGRGLEEDSLEVRAGRVRRLGL